MTAIRPLDDGSSSVRTYGNTATERESDQQVEETFVTFRENEHPEQSSTSAVASAAVDDAAYQRWLQSTHDRLSEGCIKHKKTIIRVFLSVLTVLYFVYFGWAMWYELGDEGSWRLLGFTVFAVLLFTVMKLRTIYNAEISTCWNNGHAFRERRQFQLFITFIRWFLYVGVSLTVVVYVFIDIALDQPGNLISVAGLVLFIFVFYVTSINPAKINWHTVFWGIAMQYIFALMILRTQWGYDMFKWLGDRVTEFLGNAAKGILFVFGETASDHFFAMKVMPIACFFFTFISILYYMGVMQAIIKVMGHFLSFCMGTTPAESISTAANIFVSMIEAPLMIRPFLKDMTRSELHAVMTGGFATVAGGVLGAYISFGVPANHLLSASVMSAPAALAISKLSYPETEKSKASSEDFAVVEKVTDHNVIEAATNGATSTIKVIGAIMVNVLAFLSLLAFLNATLTWFGDRVGLEKFTFEFISSYVLYPVSYFMGVQTEDCRKVAELIGVKTFTNEFIAYVKLKDLITNRHALNNYTEFYNTTEWFWEGDDVTLNITGDILKGGIIAERSEIIATYALCGFANFGSIGITLGGMGSLAPERKRDLSNMVLRSMICGNAACFMTGCIAGLLYKPF